METNWTPEKLKEFTNEIITIYEKGLIRAPIHLSGSPDGEQERVLIKLFESYNEGDWVFGTWRAHYLWLLSGRDPKELKKQIVEGHSMHIFGDRFFTSAIVAGISPIAVGVAWALKKKGSKDKVFCFLGDGAFFCGLSQEAIRFSVGHDLPIRFVFENNFLSVNAKTQETWGEGRKNKVVKYNYQRKFQHAGNGLQGEKKPYIMF